MKQVSNKIPQPGPVLEYPKQNGPLYGFQHNVMTNSKELPIVAPRGSAESIPMDRGKRDCGLQITNFQQFQVKKNSRNSESVDFDSQMDLGSSIPCSDSNIVPEKLVQDRHSDSLNLLVNIPVLEELNHNLPSESVSTAVLSLKLSGARKHRKTWKRAAGKENQDGHPTSTILKGSQSGIKWPWQLQDECDDAEL